MSQPTLALFDFCDTLVSKQTYIDFTQFACHEYWSVNRFIKNSAHRVLKRANLIHSSSYKFKQTSLLKGLTRHELADLSEKYCDYLQAFEITKVLTLLKQHQQQGHTVVIISGGLSVYINTFAKRHDISHVIAVDLEFIDSVCTGKLLNGNCMGLQKVFRLKSYFKKFDYNLAESYFYTDHSSDLPLLALVGNPVVVDCGQDLTWASFYNFPLL